MPSYYRDPDAPTPNHPRRVGVVAFIERDGALLLERRADFGTWGLVGGAVDDDESVREAIAREVREETGLETTSVELLGVFSDPSRVVAYPDGNVYRLLTLAFVVQVEGGEPRLSDESLEVRFVPLAEIDEPELSPVHVQVIDTFLAGPDGVIVA